MHPNHVYNFSSICRNIPLSSIILLNLRKPILVPMKVSPLQVLSIPVTVAMLQILLTTWHLQVPT